MDSPTEGTVQWTDYKTNSLSVVLSCPWTVHPCTGALVYFGTNYHIHFYVCHIFVTTTIFPHKMLLGDIYVCINDISNPYASRKGHTTRNQLYKPNGLRTSKQCQGKSMELIDNFRNLKGARPTNQTMPNAELN